MRHFAQQSSHWFLFALLIFSTSLIAQNDSAAYNAARNIDDPAERILALNQFIADFPESSSKGRAYNSLFRAYLAVDEGEKALEAAEAYLATMPENRRGSAYNGLAWQLAEKKVGLETAERYGKLAVEWARSTKNQRRINSHLDTHAFVLFQMGKAAEALTLQKEAVVGNETNPEYTKRLAEYYTASDSIEKGIDWAAVTILYGGDKDVLDNFNKWLTAAYPSQKEYEKMKTEIVQSTIAAYMQETSQEKPDFSKQSNAAAFMAKTDVDLAKAEAWAKAAVASVTDDTQVDPLIKYHFNLATVYFQQEKWRDVLQTVAPIKKLVSPWETNFWHMLGQTHEKTGQQNEAMAAYIAGMIVLDPPILRESLSALYTNAYGSTEGLAEKIEEAKKETASFSPGTYQPEDTPTGQVVLAELFTGSECNPCAASDIAFDILRDYYPRTTLVILEHHYHIPRPDPMTNPDTEARYRYYGGNFGTPTVFFQGQEKIVGGGPRIVAKNCFEIYDYSIQKYLKDKPEFQFSGTADINKDNISVALDIRQKEKTELTDDIRLNIALVERSVDYSGSNGIEHHAFVVRKLLNGAGGDAALFKDGMLSIKAEVDIKSVEAGITAYLNDYQEKKATRFRSSNGWRARPETLNRGNLAIVAWLQNHNTKVVLQSFYQDVASVSASK